MATYTEVGAYEARNRIFPIPCAKSSQNVWISRLTTGGVSRSSHRMLAAPISRSGINLLAAVRPSQQSTCFASRNLAAYLR
jgi:hypothetical protein